MLIFHRFPELGTAPCLVRSIELAYDEGPALTKLVALTHVGHVRTGAGYTRQAAPPLELDYEPLAVSDHVETVDAESLEHLHVGARHSQWIDLDGEGIAGLLAEDAGAWLYKRNLGEGRFAPLERIGLAPALDGSSQLADLRGVGTLALVRPNGAYERDERGGWRPFRAFAHPVTVRASDPGVRSGDFDGDGRTDLLVQADGALQWYGSAGELGYEAAETAGLALDEEDGPPALIGPADTLHLADMTGDGTLDLVRVRAGEVCYWSGLGGGRFGAKVTMASPPELGTDCELEPARLHFVDADGSGPTDLLYAGATGATLWFNQAGNSFSAPHAVEALPQVDRLTDLSVADLAGRGTGCLVWASQLPGDEETRVRFLDLMGGRKPHLLVGIRNNMGLEQWIEYASSTRYYLEDRALGRPWRTRLHFPVHVVSRVETRDRISGTTLVASYRYRDGYYDGEERAFRGFGYVEQLDADLQPGPDAPAPVLTRTWLATGVSEVDGVGSYADEFDASDTQAVSLPDTLLPPGLDAAERRQALRALAGRPLRREVFGLDGSDASAFPYSVEEHRYEVLAVQPAGGTARPVFQAVDLEGTTWTYEREPDDPRVAHTAVLAVDSFGQVTRGAQVAYRRRLPVLDAQRATLATVTEHDLTNLAPAAGGYRLGVPFESRVYELTGLDADRPLPLETLRSAATAQEIPFERTPPATGLRRRLVDRTRLLYRADDGVTPLVLGQVESRALQYETRHAAFTPGLVTAVYGTRVDAALLGGEAGYLLEDGLWWTRSGHDVLDPARFFLVTASVDPFGATTQLVYDKHSLLLERSTDPLGNEVRARNHYRTLSPWQTIDPNGTKASVRFDALGMVIATAITGPNGEGDLLDETSLEPVATDDPTTTIAIELDRFRQHGEPARLRTRSRETHADPATRWSEGIAYVDGLNRAALTKVQAEPGLAPTRDAAGALVVDADGRPVLAPTTSRWIGTGRVVYDGKGRPVRRYESYFSATDAWEQESELVEQGVSTVLRYDARGNVDRTDSPDGTFSRTVRRAWSVESWDAHDTVLESDWFARRGQLPPGDPDRRAADLAAAHAETPGIVHVDALGRSVASEVNAGSAAVPVVYRSSVEYDVEGNATRTVDARGVQAVTIRFDLTGARIAEQTASGGWTLSLPDVAGRRIRSWSAGGIAQRFVFDVLHRPTHRYVDDGAGERLAERRLYGESHLQAGSLNLRTRLFQHYDGAGVVTTHGFDFRGRALSSGRLYALAYATAPDWSAVESPASLAAAATAAAPLLESEELRAAQLYDALGRPTLERCERVAAGVATELYATRIAYNVAGLRETVDTRLRNGAWQPVLAAADYDVHRRRTSVRYGNGVETTAAYDPLDFRLRTLRSTLAGRGTLQDLAFTYDGAGNVVELADAATPTLFFANAVVPPGRRYVYDSLYRLTVSEGREHVGQAALAEYDWNDASRMTLPQPGDGAAMRRYAETFAYDETGNLTELVHRVTSATGPVRWRRTHAYAPDSDRLRATSFPGDPAQLPTRFSYDARGNTTKTPHLQTLRWDDANRLVYLTPGGGTEAFYAYDAGGTRVRKVVSRNGGAIVEDRRYIGSFEVVRRTTAAGLELERETVHVSDGTRSIALVETELRRGGTTVSPTPAWRFQLGDHLDSVSLELDETGALIGTEEYYAYGGTAYQSGRSAAETSLKRYRFSGKERDEESGFAYHGARYYAPWLGRWVSCDPTGAADGTNLFRYAACNPVKLVDPSGTSNIFSVYANRATLALRDMVALSAQNFREAGVATQNGRYMALYGTSNRVFPPFDERGAPLPNTEMRAHTHVAESSLPSGTGGDLDTIAANRTQEHTIFSHTDTLPDAKGIYRSSQSDNASLIRMNRSGTRATATTFKADGSVSVTRYARNAAGEWEVAAGRTTLGRGRALFERVRASLGNELSQFAAETGASTLSRRAVAVGNTVIEGGAKALAVAGAALGGYQVGTGIDQIANGKVGLGLVDVGEGGANLALSIGTAHAVKTGAILAETGAAAATVTLAAGVAAGVSIGIAAETARAAVKGEATPVDVMDKAYGTGFGDIHGWIQRSKYVPNIVKQADQAHDDMLTTAYYNLFLR